MRQTPGTGPEVSVRPRRGPGRPLPTPVAKAGARDTSGRPWLIATAVIVAVVLAPVGGLAYYAAKGSGDLWPHLIGSILPNALMTTGLLLLGVGAIVSVVGVGTAWLVAMHRFPGRRLFEWALLLPLAVPSYIVAYAYLDVLHPLGPVQTTLRALLGIANPRDLWFPEIRSLPGAIVLLGFVLYPYVYLPCRALFLMQSPTMVEAARTLGSSRGRVFLKVALPLARPAVAVGASLALMEALNDIGASEFLGVRTLTVSIYTTWVTRASIEGAAQIALVMLFFVLLLVTLERAARARQRFVGRAAKTRPPMPLPLAGGAGIAAAAACTLPILVGFAVPASYLVHHALIRLKETGVPAGFGGWLANTVGVAFAATLLTLAAGLVVAYAARFARDRRAGLLVKLASLGYAVPGTVLAAGMLMPFAGLDNLIADGWRALTGERIGLVLSSTGLVLVTGYVIRFLAVSTGGIEAGLAKVPPSLDMAARSLGARPMRTVAAIHVPILRPAIAAAGLLVFVDCMKELPLTLLLRPFNFETLSTTVYGEAARGTYEDGAVAALAIVVAGLLPVVLLARSSFRDAPKATRRTRVAEAPAEAAVAPAV